MNPRILIASALLAVSAAAAAKPERFVLLVEVTKRSRRSSA